MDALRAKLRGHIRRVMPLLSQGDDAACARALIMKRDTLQHAQFFTKTRRKVRHPRLDIPHPDLPRIAHRRHKAHAPGHETFPIFEPPRARGHLVTVWSGPVRGSEIDKGRVDPVKHRAAHIKKPGSPWPAQEFAPRPRKHVTADAG